MEKVHITPDGARYEGVKFFLRMLHDIKTDQVTTTCVPVDFTYKADYEHKILASNTKEYNKGHNFLTLSKDINDDSDYLNLFNIGDTSKSNKKWSYKLGQNSGLHILGSKDNENTIIFTERGSKIKSININGQLDWELQAQTISANTKRVLGGGIFQAESDDILRVYLVLSDKFIVFNIDSCGELIDRKEFNVDVIRFFQNKDNVILQETEEKQLKLFNNTKGKMIELEDKCGSDYFHKGFEQFFCYNILDQHNSEIDRTNYVEYDIKINKLLINSYQNTETQIKSENKLITTNGYTVQISDVKNLNEDVFLITLSDRVKMKEFILNIFNKENKAFEYVIDQSNLNGDEIYGVFNEINTTHNIIYSYNYGILNIIKLNK